MSEKLMNVLAWFKSSTFLSICLAFLIGALFIGVIGENPFEAYSLMLDGSVFSSLGLANTVQRAVPLIGMALATSVAFRSGILNIGTEGQMIFGGLVSAIIALYLPGPGIVVSIVAIIGGVAGGALWSIISAILQYWPGVPILVSSLLLSYPARYLSSWMVRSPLMDKEASVVATEQFRQDAIIPVLLDRSSTVGKALEGALGKGNFLSVMLNSTNWGIVLVVLLIVAILYMNKRTLIGYEFTINGDNSNFLKYGGGNEKKITIYVMALSGGISGLVGAIFTIGAPSTRLIDGALLSTNYAWTGLMVALLASYAPIAVALVGLFFGAIMAGAGAMSRGLEMSPQIASVIQGIVIILSVFKISLPRFKAKKDFRRDLTDAISKEVQNA